MAVCKSYMPHGLMSQLFMDLHFWLNVNESLRHPTQAVYS